MPATVTLSATTLTSNVTSGAPQVLLASTSGLTKGTRLYLDQELMEVVSIGVDPWVNVIRGVDGTTASAHFSGSTVIIGRGDQFYSQDPVGVPPFEIPVSPYINALTGAVWYSQGNADGSSARWWQKADTSYGVGALGVRTTSLDPTSST